jgi:hypothetical protein
LHKSIDGGHYHAHFCSQEKKTLMNLCGGVDEPTTIVGLLGDGVATQGFFFQISKVGWRSSIRRLNKIWL